MSTVLPNCRVLMFVDDVYEDLELWYPKLRLIEAGAHVTVAGPKGNHVYAGKHGFPCRGDAAIAEMEASDFHGLVIPGGFMPDKLRRDAKVLSLVREFAQAGKLVAAICHGGWIPISAGVYQRRPDQRRRPVGRRGGGGRSEFRQQPQTRRLARLLSGGDRRSCPGVVGARGAKVLTRIIHELSAADFGSPSISIRVPRNSRTSSAVGKSTRTSGPRSARCWPTRFRFFLLDLGRQTGSHFGEY